jgi:putative thioredoxin
VAVRAGRPDAAERLFQQARELDPAHPIAALGLGRLAAMRGDSEQARSMLLPLRPDPEAERLLAAIEVSEWAAATANGEDPLARAERAAAEGRFQEALEGLLGRIQAGDEDRDAAREAMLKVFSVLGEEDGLTQEYRRRLAAALF